MKIGSVLLLVSASILVIMGGGLLYKGFSAIAETESQTEESLEEAYQNITKNTGKEPSYEADQISPKIPSFQIGESIGILQLPSIDGELPIIEGTDEDELEKGVGHFSSTVLPGQGDQILLSGHRDTVFRRLGDVQIGDLVHVVMPYGKYTYKMNKSYIVDADDTTVIRSTAPEELLTISTCYPFSFIGDAPDRYILEAELIEVNQF
ncbi:class D sortase [Cytobacillus gottheilii]|uniref:class D sortase n=1 Tax=Cytobacillus gottheilii TaxID=859144 RepID=UPI0021474063|nr:class D sortase [Cytobacillus gottheilii]